MYIEFQSGQETYKLRLSTKMSVNLEKALGYNPLQILFDVNNGVLPKKSDIITILHYMLQDCQHNLKMEDTFDIFDSYISDGHNLFDFIPIFIDVFRESGYMPADDEEVVEDPNV